MELVYRNSKVGNSEVNLLVTELDQIVKKPYCCTSTQALLFHIDPSLSLPGTTLPRNQRLCRDTSVQLPFEFLMWHLSLLVQLLGEFWL